MQTTTKTPNATLADQRDMMVGLARMKRGQTRVERSCTARDLLSTVNELAEHMEQGIANLRTIASAAITHPDVTIDHKALVAEARHLRDTAALLDNATMAHLRNIDQATATIALLESLLTGAGIDCAAEERGS